VSSGELKGSRGRQSGGKPKHQPQPHNNSNIKAEWVHVMPSPLQPSPRSKPSPRPKPSPFRSRSISKDDVETSPKHLSDLLRLFDELDAEGLGYITQKQLGQFF